jgi:CarD family transcriptional regulator
MFQVNDYIIYGDSGVCFIADITKPPIGGVDKNKNYYILHPYYSAGKTIYTPVDNDKVSMRKILTRQEAEDLINRIPYIETIWIENEKSREDVYKKAMRTYACEAWVRIIKTLYLRKEERKAGGKVVTATDERYFKAAESYLYGELSLSLGIPLEEVKNFVERSTKTVEIK